MSENLPVLVQPVRIGSDHSVPSSSPAEEAVVADRARRIRRMVSLARLMDAAFKIPGTNYSIGIDPLVGLIPIVGDIITTSVSLFIMYDAIKLGATSNQIFRMTANICIDLLVGELLVVGDVIDFAWKANIRNLAVMGLTAELDSSATTVPKVDPLQQ